MFENKKIFILGMARSGYESAKFLSSFNNNITIVDGAKQDENHVLELENLGVKVIITENQKELIDETFDYMIKNPGIKYDNECVVKAKDLNIKVINELEMAYFFINKKTKIIGVTGSNGKTTTVTLIDLFLKQQGINSILCGNIGFPVISILDKIKDDSVLVIEISDHQLCDMYDFKTNISVLTNIYKEVHIDFHDSFERYKNMKKRIFNNHTNDDLAVINSGNTNSLDVTEHIDSKKLYFGNSTDICCVYNDGIYYDRDLVISLNDIRLKGNHNYENIMAAIIVAKEFNVDNESIKKVLNNFSGVEHRIEFVREFNKVTYYNDSKSTNNTATITALQSFSNPVILLMGGLDRNLEFDELSDYMNNVKYIISYGETKNKINDFASKYSINCEVVDTLEVATKKAINLSTEGDTVLLSPACASWDQFKCFEDRGNEFKKIVNEL